MPHMAALGITRIANVTGLDTIGIPVVMVTRPNAKSLSVAQGKGPTLACAKASGLMEAIESHHAENITRPLKLANFTQLQRDHRMIDLPSLPGYAGATFHSEQRTLWIEGQDLADGGPRWLPFALAHTDFTLPLPPGSGAFFMGSSGLASGNHPLEAIVHGLCELIERDAATMFRLAGDEARRAARIDLDTIDDPGCRALLGQYGRAGVSVAVSDITGDAGVAAFHAVVIDREPNLARALGPMGGMGCHPAREIALSRALTEAAQSRLTLIAGARDDMVSQRLAPDAYLRAHADFHAARLAPGPLRRYSDIPTHAHARLEDDLGFILGRLRAIGCGQVVAINLTRPEVGIPVVRMVVPGLEILNDLPGYSPGRRARPLCQRRAAR